jgi:RecA-family ATPase
MTMERLDAICKKKRPDILIVDQLDKVNVFGAYSRQDQRLREVYKQAREIAKRYDIFVIGISQASADAEGKTKVTYSMMEESKTGKAAEADLIVGIGRRPTDDNNPEGDDRIRYLTASKNKITGYHGTVGVVLEGEKSIYRA